ncbi:MAG: class I SAM-dependent methyltransferase [Imperialibacter sp.]|uniref:class I SAM-dependent methyltransferase n=1 Tax=Imperialibacter sp. TaxID=2038411 RepID=UPI003A88951B
MIGFQQFLVIMGMGVVLMSCGGETANNDESSQKKEVVGTESAPVAGEDLFSDEFEDPDRDSWQKPGEVIKKFGDAHGKKIADIGAGAGYFTLRLAAAGANVIAIDIDDNFLQHIEEEATKLPTHVGSIETRKTVPETPGIAINEADGVLIVNTASFLPERKKYFSEIMGGLKEGGQLVIVDFKPERSPVTPPDNLWISSQKLVNELKTVGFTIKEVDAKTLPYQYIITATKR